MVLLLFFSFLFSRVQVCRSSNLGFKWTLPPPIYYFFLCPCSFHAYVCIVLCFYAHLCMLFGPLEFYSPSFFSYLLGWECGDWGKETIAKVFSSLGFRWELSPLVFICPCVHNLVFLCVPSHIIWALKVLLPFFLSCLHLSGNAMAKTWVPLPKLLQAWVSSEHFHPLVYVFIVSMFFPYLHVHGLLFLCMPSHVVWSLGLQSFAPLLFFMFAKVGV